MIYLDYAATAPPKESVIQRTAQGMRDFWPNPSSVYSAAGGPRREMRLARKTIGALVGGAPEQIFFTSGGTESNNWAMQAAAGKHAVISAQEHPSVLEAAHRYCAEVTEIAPGRDGRISPEAIDKAIRPETALVSVQMVNSETGVVQPVEAIAHIAHEKGALFHCDAVQAAGHIPVCAEEWRIDLLSASAHKFSGPRGIGLLFLRQGVLLPTLHAGGGQEFGMRSGTENVSAILGMETAALEALDAMASEQERMRVLAELFRTEIQLLLPEGRLLFEKVQKWPGIMALHLPGVPSEHMIARLDRRSICVSGGSACAAGSREPSRAYLAAGLSEREALCVVRLSMGTGTTQDHMQTAAKAIAEEYRLLLPQYA